VSAGFFHGGVPNLRKGDLLLSPARTGAPSLASFGGEGVTSRDRVYVIDDLEQARLFALLAPPRGNGSLYEVEPIGKRERDPDYLGIVRVVDRCVTSWQGLTMVQAAALLSSVASAAVV
jgi:Rifampin ADP-ribosyl transferase